MVVTPVVQNQHCVMGIKKKGKRLSVSVPAKQHTQRSRQPHTFLWQLQNSGLSWGALEVTIGSSCNQSFYAELF